MVGLSATAETVAHFEVYLIKNDHFGPCLDLPTGTAQWASNYGVMNLTHRRVHHGNMVGFLQIQWLHLLCEPVSLSVNFKGIQRNITKSFESKNDNNCSRFIAFNGFKVSFTMISIIP